jgi:hypothetical protein
LRDFFCLITHAVWRGRSFQASLFFIPAVGRL